MGTKDDGSDSAAVEVAPASHWPDMRAIILVANAGKKDVSSTAGMQQTVHTSALMQHRIQNLVPQRMKEMEKAVTERDFESFARLTMKDSNTFHATCLDTDPPIFYMNDTSRAAIRMVDSINETAGKVVAAYTFDAGPNAVVYYLAESESKVAGVFKSILGDKVGWDGARGKAVSAEQMPKDSEIAADRLKEGVSRVILTGVGEGPIKTTESLIGEQGSVMSK